MTLALNHISSELESGVLKTSSRAEFNVELIFHSDSAAIERWKSVLSKRGSTLFHSIEWMELLRAVYKLPLRGRRTARGRAGPGRAADGPSVSAMDV